jgi:hypothetical protein
MFEQRISPMNAVFDFSSLILRSMIFGDVIGIDIFIFEKTKQQTRYDKCFIDKFKKTRKEIL